MRTGSFSNVRLRPLSVRYLKFRRTCHNVVTSLRVSYDRRVGTSQSLTSKRFLLTPRLPTSLQVISSPLLPVRSFPFVGHVSPVPYSYTVETPLVTNDPHVVFRVSVFVRDLTSPYRSNPKSVSCHPSLQFVSVPFKSKYKIFPTRTGVPPLM